MACSDTTNLTWKWKTSYPAIFCDEEIIFWKTKIWRHNPKSETVGGEGACTEFQHIACSDVPADLSVGWLHGHSNGSHGCTGGLGGGLVSRLGCVGCMPSLYRVFLRFRRLKVLQCRLLLVRQTALGSLIALGCSSDCCFAAILFRP